MDNLIPFARNEVVITLKEITDLIDIQHSKAMLKVEALSKEPSFGEVSKIDTFNLNNVKVTTYKLNKKQAIAVGARLNNSLLMKVIDRLEELENENKPKTQLDLIIQSAQEMQHIKQVQIAQSEDINYLKNTSPILYNQIKILEDKRKSRTKQLVGYNPDCEKSKANYSRTIRALTKKFKDRFSVARYADLPKFKYSEALEWVSNVELVDLI